MADGIHEVRISKNDRGYWDVHINGKFYCTADSYSEALNELWNANV